MNRQQKFRKSASENQYSDYHKTKGLALDRSAHTISSLVLMSMDFLHTEETTNADTAK
jgi:hypothetical protein